MKAVKVEWIDSCTSNINWVLLEDIDEVEPINITTYGTIIKETDDYMCIAQNYGSNPEQICNVTSIPKGCIKNIIELKDATKH